MVGVPLLPTLTVIFGFENVMVLVVSVVDVADSGLV
jgi:hypothetical protein